MDHPHAAAAHSDHADDAALAELLDLDGEVLCGYWAAALGWVRREATVTGRDRILDLGAGSGVGTIALAQRFAGAEVIAVDVSEPMLSRIRVKALDLGLAGRVHTVQADLDAEWPALEPVDVTWASMSMHHLADPDRVLADVFAITRPGGLLAVAELAEHVRFLPDDLGFGLPGLEGRCLDALAREHAHALPELGSHWAPRIDAAGFAVLAERTFTIELDPPHSPATVRYARSWLGRLRSGLADGLADGLAPDDLAALTAVLDGAGPHSLTHRTDLQVRGARTVTLARRP